MRFPFGCPDPIAPFQESPSVLLPVAKRAAFPKARAGGSSVVLRPSVRYVFAQILPFFLPVACLCVLISVLLQCSSFEASCCP